MNNQTVAITGASSGIGLDIAKRYFYQGANVVMNARNKDKLKAVVAEMGDHNRIAIFAGDIGDKKTGQGIVEKAVEQFGQLDVLVNNAGIFGTKPFLDNTEEDIEQYIHINLKGTYFVTQAAVQQMKKQHSGSIVNIGTVLAQHPMAGAPASAALITKGGVHALTTSLASELAADNIRVNAVAPGIIRTPIHNGMDVDSLGGIALMDRVGEVEEITDAVIHLASATFTTGVIMPVDGGYVHGRA